jgi:hypothetical protein
MRIVDFDKTKILERIKAIECGRPIDVIASDRPLSDLLATAAACLAILHREEAQDVAGRHKDMHPEHLELLGQMKRDEVTAAALLAADLACRVLSGQYDEDCDPAARFAVELATPPVYLAVGAKGVRKGCPVCTEVL